MSKAELGTLSRIIDMCPQVASAAHILCEPRAIKRKDTEESSSPRNTKQHKSSAAVIECPESPLVAILNQYGLLEAVVSNISAIDLLALMLTSRTLHEAIASERRNLENLLGRTQCSSNGIRIRAAYHRKSVFFDTYGCTEYAACSSGTSRVVEIRPCATCKVATCDECRVHVVYQSIYEAPNDPNDTAELPNFSGFVLLKPLEQPILSPHHLPSQDTDGMPGWQDPSLSQGKPYHDQGFLDVPLELDAVAPPESIEHILDLDLGQRSLKSISQGSQYASPSPVLRSLSDFVEERKIRLCSLCLERDRPEELNALLRSCESISLSNPIDMGLISKCRCTLRKRFLDRWLCLRCFQAEELIIRDCTRATPDMGATPTRRYAVCECGLDAAHVVCLWCSGEVDEPELEAFDRFTEDNTPSL